MSFLLGLIVGLTPYINGVTILSFMFLKKGEEYHDEEKKFFYGISSGICLYFIFGK